MKKSWLISATAALLLAGTAAHAAGEKPKAEDMAQESPPEGRAVINFAHLRGTIHNWEAEGSKALYIEAPRGTWYRAEFMGPCLGLPFATSIGFVTDSLNQIDRFSSVVVGNERCWFKSFERSDPPDDDDDGEDGEK